MKSRLGNVQRDPEFSEENHPQKPSIFRETTVWTDLQGYRDLNGNGPARIRTVDQEIMSPSLLPLSYGAKLLSRKDLRAGEPKASDAGVAQRVADDLLACVLQRWPDLSPEIRRRIVRLAVLPKRAFR